MEFKEILRDLVDGVQGGVAATLMGTDGLAIEQYSAAVHYDIDTVAVEYGAAIAEMKNASSILRLGEVEEIVITTAGSEVLVKMISPEYFIAFVLTKGSSTGKARFLLKLAAARAGKELSQ